MSAGYLCPQCLGKHRELPVEYRACSLTLVSAPHLATLRSYYYLLPVEHFRKQQNTGEISHCYGGQRNVTANKKIHRLPHEDTRIVDDRSRDTGEVKNPWSNWNLQSSQSDSTSLFLLFLHFL